MNKLRIMMTCKKIIIAVLIITFIPILAFGENINQTISAILSKDIKITWNGISFTPTEDDGSIVYPISYKGRTFLPVRYIAEKAGVTVNWDNSTKTVILNQIKSDGESISNNNYIRLSANEILNCYGSTSVTLPEGIGASNIEAVVIMKNGKQVSAGISINNSALNIAPNEYFLGGQTYEIRIITKTNRYSIAINTSKYTIEQSYDGVILKVPPNPVKGFNYPYYLYLPTDIEKNTLKKYMVVEPNNTGTVNDALVVHDVAAHWDAYANGDPAHKVADSLKTPMLKPVFPRPSTDFWLGYTHALDRGAMLLQGDMKRLDLQLIQMINDSKTILGEKNIKIEDKVFLTGFSASGQFVQRFSILHPEKVKAIFAGGFTMYPVEKLNGVTLRYPFGISDIKEISGNAFNKVEYDKIAQFYYTGDLDDHDLPYEVDYGFEKPEIDNVNKLFGYDYGVPKWNRRWEFVKQIGYDTNIQFNIYKGIGHDYPLNMLKDIVEFFKANSGDKIMKIKAHNTAEGID